LSLFFDPGGVRPGRGRDAEPQVESQQLVPERV